MFSHSEHCVSEFLNNPHREQVGSALGLLPDRRRCVGRLRDVDSKFFLAGAWRGRYRRRVVAQTAATVTRLIRGKTQVRFSTVKSGIRFRFRFRFKFKQNWNVKESRPEPP